MDANDDVAATLIEMEKAALRRWGRGDPSGFLEISAPDVVYFDPFQEHRIDGLEALTRYYESLRGSIRVERDEMLNPKVQRAGSAAVLTFNYVSYGSSENQCQWHCTEVYRRDGEHWRIIQTHWSLPKSA